MSNPLLFVYGTLLKKADNELSRFLEAHSRRLGPATYQGKLFLIGWYPGLVPSDSSSDQVLGELLELDDNHETVLLKLDEYEGVNNPPKAEDEYERKKITVHIENRREICYAYVYRASTETLESIHDGDFLRYLDNKKSN